MVKSDILIYVVKFLFTENNSAGIGIIGLPSGTRVIYYPGTTALGRYTVCT